MKKFFAILMDSAKEALSGWLLQIMLVFACLLILFIASIGFRPLSMQELLGQSTRVFNRLLPLSPEYPKFGSPVFGIENYKTTNEAEPWLGSHDFEFVITCPDEKALEAFKDEGRSKQLPASRAGVQRFIRQAFDFLEDVTVKEAGSTSKEMRFTVHAEKTKIKEVREWAHEPSVLFAFEAPILSGSQRSLVYLLQKWLVNGAGSWVLLAVSVIATAGFIPTLLTKGHLDLYISKPISKSTLLVWKYFGGLTFVAVLTTFTGLGVWVVVGLRTGIWTANFLLIIPILLLYFSVLYAVSTLAAVLTRNTLVAILATILAWALFWGVGKVYDGVKNREEAEAKQADKPLEMPTPDEGGKIDPDDVIRRIDPDAPLWGVIPRWLFIAPKMIHFVTPRTFELDSRLGRIIAEGVLSERELKQADYDEPPRENWFEMIGISSLFIGACLGLSCLIMSRRDS